MTTGREAGKPAPAAGMVKEPQCNHVIQIKSAEAAWLGTDYL